MSVTTVDIIKKEKVDLEEFWVIRGIKDTGLNKTVVAEHRTAFEPKQIEIAQFLLNHPEADFCSVSHDYAIYEGE